MAVLLIGLGGTGGEVLRIIKNKMKDSPFANEVAYYYLDSRAEAGEGFDPGEFRFFGGFRVSEIIKDHAKNIRKWWYPIKPPDKNNYQPDFDTRDGAGQCRLIGRLCYYLNADTIIRDIESILTNKLLGEFVDVIVVASSSGGTGSAVFCDIGFLLKNIISQKRRAKYIGVCLDPSVVRDRISMDEGQKRLSEINGLAFLTELEYFMENKEKYTFGVLSRGKLEEIKSSYPTPYDSICLIQIENKEGFHLSDRNDYFALLAEGIWHLINISFREIGGISGGTGLENYLHRLWGAKPIRDKVQYYASFGCAAIIFPFDNVFAYCFNRYASTILDKFLEDLTLEEVNTVVKAVNDFILSSGIKETDNNDHLINLGRNLLHQINSQWASTSEAMINNFAKKLIGAGDNFDAVIEEYKNRLLADLKRLSERELKTSLDQKRLQVIKKLKERIDDILRNDKWRRAQKYLETIIEALKLEVNDLSKNEEEWLKRNPIERINSDLNASLNDIKKLSSPNFFQKLFRRGAIREEIKWRKNRFARQWVENYFKRNFYEAILDEIKAFYGELISDIGKIYDEISLSIRSFEELKRNLRIHGILNTRIDVPGKKAGIDFIFTVCSSEEVVERMIYENYFKIHLDEDIREVARQRTIEGFNSVINNTVKRVLSQINLDEALKLETKYFWSFRPINLKAVFTTGTQSDKKRIINELRDIYGVSCLREIEDILDKKHFVITKDEETKIINKLIEGRISLLLKWARPFWCYRREQIGVANPFVFSIYHINDNNQITKGIIDRLKIAEAETRGYALNDPHKILFFQFEGIQPLFNLEPINKLKEREKERRRLIRDKEQICNPEELGHNDRKFIFDKPASDFSIFPVLEEDEVFLIFTLAELFGYINPTSKKTRSNFRLTIDLGTPKGISGQLLGKSLLDSLKYLGDNGEVFDAMNKKCVEYFNEEKVRNPKGLQASVNNLLNIYASFRNKYQSKKDANLRELYERLHDSLRQFAEDNDLI